MDLRLVLESLLFATQKPLNPAELRELCRATAEQSEEVRQHKALSKPSVNRIKKELEELAEEHERAQRSYRLVCVAEAWQFVSRSEYAPWVRALVGQKPRPAKLSKPALETLAIIAYRQPLTRAEAEQIRGVSVDGVVQTLLEKNLIEQRGRAEIVGRPMTYGTTEAFLEQFGLGSLEDLPAAPELRRIKVERPETIPTVEEKLETAADSPGDNSDPNTAGTDGDTGNEPAKDVPENQPGN